jgi:hypothetical protein
MTLVFSAIECDDEYLAMQAAGSCFCAKEAHLRQEYSSGMGDLQRSHFLSDLMNMLQNQQQRKKLFGIYSDVKMLSIREFV